MNMDNLTKTVVVDDASSDGPEHSGVAASHLTYTGCLRRARISSRYLQRILRATGPWALNRKILGDAISGVPLTGPEVASIWGRSLPGMAWGVSWCRGALLVVSWFCGRPGRSACRGWSSDDLLSVPWAVVAVAWFCLVLFWSLGWSFGALLVVSWCPSGGLRVVVNNTAVAKP